MRLLYTVLFLTLSKIFGQEDFDYIPKDTDGRGYFISYKDNIRMDVRVEDVDKEFDDIRKNLK